MKSLRIIHSNILKKRIKRNKMEELKIQIEVIEDRMLSLENKVDYFSVNVRSPYKKDRFEQIRLLNEWKEYDNQLSVLKDVLNAIESNAKAI